MQRVERSLLLGFTPLQLLALVQDVACYPEFVPGCVSASVEPLGDAEVRASLQFRFAGITERFTTHNKTMQTAYDEYSLQMHLLRGPFKSLMGEWRLQPLGNAACKATLRVDLDWGGFALGRLLMPQLDRAVGNVMQAFKLRAQSLYGDHVQNH